MLTEKAVLTPLNVENADAAGPKILGLPPQGSSILGRNIADEMPPDSNVSRTYRSIG